MQSNSFTVNDFTIKEFSMLSNVKIDQSTSCLLKRLCIGKGRGGISKLLIVQKLYIFLLFISSQSKELHFKILSSFGLIKRINILISEDSLSTFVIFSLFFILNNHCEQLITVMQVNAFPFVDCDSFDLLIQPESNIPHPNHSVFI